jgi:hypothetical protein
MEQAIRQRLRFELAGLECRDLEQQSVGGARLLLQQELTSGANIKSALQELLSGGRSKQAGIVHMLLSYNVSKQHGWYILQVWTRAPGML